jgi:hypothetical protein
VTRVGRAWVIVWEGTPPPNMNGGVSRWTTIKERRRWRANAAILGRVALLPKREIVRYRAEAVFYRRAMNVADPDGDGSRLKSVIDGLVAEKYLPGDTRRYVEWGEISERRGPPGFALTITELDYDAETAEHARRQYARGDDVEPLAEARRLARRGGAGRPAR